MKHTIQEAIDLGYTHWGIDEQDFQQLTKLEDTKDLDLDENAVLADTKVYHPSISEEALFDLISDHIESNSEFSDDTDAIRDNLKKGVDWCDLSNQLNISLEKIDYWFLTDIKLIGNEPL